MTECANLNLTFKQGTTYNKAVSWFGAGKVCKLIESLTVGCPTVVNITSHGIPNGGDIPVFISHVKGATRANYTKSPVAATYIDANSFYIDADTVGQEYESGTGLLTYYAPTDLTNYTARMMIREDIDDATPIDELTDASGELIITPALGKVTISIPASVTAGYTFDEAVYDLELVDDSVEPVVTRIVEGRIELCKEVTR
jgi:hypothetical protein